MSNQRPPASDEQGITWEEGEAMLKRTVDRFQRGAVDELVGRYSDDIVIRFADLPEIVGKPAALRFLKSRLRRMKDYRLEKKLFKISGQKMGNTWTGNWTDSVTGLAMEGRGVEFLELKSGQVIRWEASFNIWRRGASREESYSAYEED